MSVKSHERHTKKRNYTWGECGFKFPHFHAKLENVPLLITLKEVYFLGADDEVLQNDIDDESFPDLIPLTPVDSLTVTKKNLALVKEKGNAMPGDPLFKAILTKSKQRSHDEKPSEERLEKIMDKVQNLEKELKRLKKSFVKYGPVYETRFATMDPDSSGTSRFPFVKKYEEKPLKSVNETAYGRVGRDQESRKVFDRIKAHPRAIEFSRDSESLLMSKASQNVFEKIRTTENQNLLNDELTSPVISKKVHEKKADSEKSKEHHRKKDRETIKDLEKKKHSDKEKKHDKKVPDKARDHDRKKAHEKNRETSKKKESDKKDKHKEEEEEKKSRRHREEGSTGPSKKRHRAPSTEKLKDYDSHPKYKYSSHRDVNSKKKPYESSCSKFVDESYAQYQRNKVRMKVGDEANRRRWLEILECLYTPKSAYRPSASSLQSISDPFMTKSKVNHRQDGMEQGPNRVNPILRMPSADRWPTKWVTKETNYTF